MSYTKEDVVALAQRIYVRDISNEQVVEEYPVLDIAKASLTIASVFFEASEIYLAGGYDDKIAKYKNEVAADAGCVGCDSIGHCGQDAESEKASFEKLMETLSKATRPTTLDDFILATLRAAAGKKAG